jgi:hypothetical protein
MFLFEIYSVLQGTSTSLNKEDHGGTNVQFRQYTLHLCDVALGF